MQQGITLGRPRPWAITLQLHIYTYIYMKIMKISFLYKKVIQIHRLYGIISKFKNIGHLHPAVYFPGSSLPTQQVAPVTQLLCDFLFFLFFIFFLFCGTGNQTQDPGPELHPQPGLAQRVGLWPCRPSLLPGLWRGGRTLCPGPDSGWTTP